MLEDELREREPEFRDEEKQELEKDNAGVQEKVYDSNKYISGARRMSNGTVPMNILQFQYPFLVMYTNRDHTGSFFKLPNSISSVMAQFVYKYSVKYCRVTKTKIFYLKFLIK